MDQDTRHRRASHCGERGTWIVVSIGLLMALGCVFWHPILWFVWCTVLKRC